MVAFKRTCLDTLSGTCILPKYNLLCCMLDRRVYVICMSYVTYHACTFPLPGFSFRRPLPMFIYYSLEVQTMFLSFSPQKDILYSTESFRLFFGRWLERYPKTSWKSCGRPSGKSVSVLPVRPVLSTLITTWRSTLEGVFFSFTYLVISTDFFFCCFHR